MENPISPARTVCHGCRAATHELVAHLDGERRYRPVLLPGDGSMLREAAPGMIGGRPCPVCGDTEDGGWMPGFTPPT